MRNKVLMFGAVVFQFVFAISAAASDEGTGGKAGAFLRIGVGARALGMGRAYTALATDGTASYWNPAGLGQISQREFYGMYSVLSLDRMHNYVSYSHPIGCFGALSASWTNFRVGDIDGRDQSGQPTGTFSDNEMAFGLAYGKTVTQYVSVGLCAQYISHALADYKAAGIGINGGVLLTFNSVRIGLSAQNVASELKWNTASGLKEKIPVTLRGGMAYSPIEIVTLAIDVEKLQYEAKYRIHSGGELWLRGLGLRAGYDDGEFAGGVSARVKNLQVDYAFAFADFGDNGATSGGNEFAEASHRMGVTVKF